MTAVPRVAVYPGSFDPPTLGHVDIVTRATRLFDRVIVAILSHHGKQPLFAVDDRMAMLKEIFATQPAVSVDRFNGLLVDYAARQGATAVVRGIRNVTDFDFERQMALTNRHMAGDIETVFLTPAPEVGHISSTLVREILSVGGSVRGLVPPAVEAALAKRRQTSRTRDV